MNSSHVTSLVLVLAVGCGSASTADTTATTEAETTSGSHATSAAPTLSEVVAMAHRSDENRARDVYRHPAETLAFFGIRNDMRVLELSPGNGWYTEILAPYLRDQGHLIAAIPSTDSPSEYRRNSATRFMAQLEERAPIYGTVETVTLSTPETIELGPDGSVDAVLTFRNLHNWMSDARLDEVLAASFRVLAPGGVFGVVEHRAAPGTDPAAGGESGYLPEAWVIERATAAGFVLEESSEINANPADDHDHPNGVWSLPPALRGGDVDRDAFVAIGESDRMTLRFRKPS
jgi:predicted methyltransferase